MEQPKENKMGTMPVNKLLVTMSLPMVISMIVQALYNIVDSIFVSRLFRRRIDSRFNGISNAKPYDFRSSRNRGRYKRNAFTRTRRKKVCHGQPQQVNNTLAQYTYLFGVVWHCSTSFPSLTAL